MAHTNSCSFVQVQSICSIEKSLVVTDVAAGKIKDVSGLSRTVLLLKMLYCLYMTYLVFMPKDKQQKQSLSKTPNKTLTRLTVIFEVPLSK